VDAAHATLGTTLAKIDAKGGCSAPGDAPSVALLVDRFSEELAQELNGTCLPAGSPCGNITLCCAGLACTVTTLGQTPVCGSTRGRLMSARRAGGHYDATMQLYVDGELLPRRVEADCAALPARSAVAGRSGVVVDAADEQSAQGSPATRRSGDRPATA